MKKILYILIAGLMIISSCDEDFLDQYPPQNITEGNFYQTEDQMILAANSVYNQFYNIWGEGSLPYLYGEMYGGDSYVYISVGTASDWEDLGETVVFPGTGLIAGAWNSYYSGIYKVNDFLEVLDEFDSDKFTTPNLGTRLRAEALFTRACFYYYLTQCFGDVPLVTSVLTPDEAKSLTRDPESAVVAQIEEDLNFAEQNLPPSYSPEEVGRPTSYAAKAMQARVFMAYGKNSEAQTVLQEIVNSGMFTLDADGSGEATPEDYLHIFHDDTKNSPSSIFELQFIPGANGRNHTYVWSYTPVHPMKLPGYDLTFNTWGLGAVSQELYDEFETEDTTRRWITGKMFLEDGTYMPHTRKYFYGYNDGTPYNIGSNVPIIRYSEILLNLAEITNDPQYLNMVRDRYGLPGWGEVGYPTDLYPTFERALEHERRMEFAFEFQRGFDLKRTGRFTAVKSEETGRNIPETAVIFPIPTAVLDVNSGMSQNDGY